MREHALTLPVTLACAECGAELDAELAQVSSGNYRLKPVAFVVTSCDACTEKARRAGIEAEREAHE